MLDAEIKRGVTLELDSLDAKETRVKGQRKTNSW
jgi:hypothetical protein